MTNKFKQAGYTAELITGSMKSEERKTLIDNFKMEGTDISFYRCSIRRI